MRVRQVCAVRGVRVRTTLALSRPPLRAAPLARGFVSDGEGGPGCGEGSPAGARLCALSAGSMDLEHIRCSSLKPGD